MQTGGRGCPRRTVQGIRPKDEGRVPTLYQRRADGGGCAARRFRDYLHFVRQAARRATGRALDDGHHKERGIEMQGSSGGIANGFARRDERGGTDCRRGRGKGREGRAAERGGENDRQTAGGLRAGISIVGVRGYDAQGDCRHAGHRATFIIVATGTGEEDAAQDDEAVLGGRASVATCSCYVLFAQERR